MLIHGTSRLDVCSVDLRSDTDPVRRDDSATGTSAAGSMLARTPADEGPSDFAPGGEHFRLPGYATERAPRGHSGHHGHRGHHGHFGVRDRATDGSADLLSKIFDAVEFALSQAQPSTSAVTSDTTSETTTATAHLEANPTSVAYTTSLSATTAPTPGSAQSPTAATTAVAQTSIGSFTMISSLSSLANSPKNL